MPFIKGPFCRVTASNFSFFPLYLNLKSYVDLGTQSIGSCMQYMLLEVEEKAKFSWRFTCIICSDWLFYLYSFFLLLVFISFTDLYSYLQIIIDLETFLISYVKTIISSFSHENCSREIQLHPIHHIDCSMINHWLFTIW